MGIGPWGGLGSKATSAKAKCGPSWVMVSSDHRRRQTTMASSKRAPRLAGSNPSGPPLRLEPARTGTDHGAAAREPVQGGEGPGGDEGVAQAEEVDVGAEPDPGGAGGQEGEHRRGVEELASVGGTGGCSAPAKGEPAMATGRTRCSGNQTESNPNWSASLGRFGPDAGMHTPEGHGELHVGSPGTAAKLTADLARSGPPSNML